MASASQSARPLRAAVRTVVASKRLDAPLAKPAGEGFALFEEEQRPAVPTRQAEKELIDRWNGLSDEKKARYEERAVAKQEKAATESALEQGLDAPLLQQAEKPPPVPLAAKVTKAVRGACAGFVGAAAALSAWLGQNKLRLTMVVAIGGVMLWIVFAFECFPLNHAEQPYADDVVSCLVGTRTLLPWKLLPLQNSFKVVLVFLAFGFDLRLKPKASSSIVANAPALAAKAVVGSGLIYSALHGYYHDFQKLLATPTSGACSELQIGPIARIALLPVVVTLSPNYSAAVAMWSKLAIQSPVAALKLKPRYKTLPGSFIRDIGFPVHIGQASWLPVLTQLCALVLLPYIIFKKVLLHVVNVLLLGNLVVDLACFQCKWVVIGLTSCGALICFVFSIVLLVVTCMSAAALGNYYYWVDLLWPAFYFGVLSVWAGATPKLLVFIYCSLQNLGWRDVWRGIWQSSPPAQGAWTSWVIQVITQLVTNLQTSGIWRVIWSSLQQKITSILLEDIWAGLPRPLKLDKNRIVKLWEYNHTPEFDPPDKSDLEESAADLDMSNPLGLLGGVMQQARQGLNEVIADIGSDAASDSGGGSAVAEQPAANPAKAKADAAAAAAANDLATDVKVAIVYSTLQGVVYVALQQMAVLYAARLLIVAFGNTTYSGILGALQMTLFERQVGLWASALRGTQDHLVERLFHISVVQEVVHNSLPSGTLSYTCSAVESTRLPIPSADAVYVCSAVLVLYAIGKLMLPALRYAWEDKNYAVRLLTAGSCVLIVVLIAMTRADFVHGAQKPWPGYGVAALLLFLRISGVIALARTLPLWPNMGPLVLKVLGRMLLPKTLRALDFFWGLGEEHDKGSAEAFVQQVIQWGGVYPKLAQRLRTDKAIVTSEALRDAFKDVMEHCKPRSDFEVIEHLRTELLLRRSDVEVKKTLGTGSVAQVALIRYRRGDKMVDAVMKMTWPQDEQRFMADFALFDTMQRYLPKLVKLVGEQADLMLFLKTVLAKKADILREFNLTYEFKNTAQGQTVMEKWSPVVLEQAIGVPPTLLQLQREALQSRIPMEEVVKTSKPELSKAALERRLVTLTLRDSEGAAVTLVKHGQSIKCVQQRASESAPLEGVDWGTRRYRCGGAEGTVPAEQLPRLAALLKGLFVGLDVKGKYQNGNWYKAKIASINADGTYTVDWADEDAKDRVKSAADLRAAGVPFEKLDEVYVPGGVGEVYNADTSGGSDSDSSGSSDSDSDSGSGSGAGAGAGSGSDSNSAPAPSSTPQRKTIGSTCRVFTEAGWKNVEKSELQAQSFAFTDLGGSAITVLGRGPEARISTQHGAIESFDAETRRYRLGGHEGTVPEDQVESLQRRLGPVTRYLPKTLDGAAILVDEGDGKWRLDSSQLNLDVSSGAEDVESELTVERPEDLKAAMGQLEESEQHWAGEPQLSVVSATGEVYAGSDVFDTEPAYPVRVKIVGKKVVKKDLCCPKGHVLKPFCTPHDHYRCDVCKQRQDQGADMWGCRMCNYDMCKRCAGPEQERGMRYLLAKNLDKKDTAGDVLAWGTVIESGSDEGDGWVKVELPDKFEAGDKIVCKAGRGGCGKVKGPPRKEDGKLAYPIQVGEEEGLMKHSHLALAPFEFTDAEGAKLTITGRGSSAKCTLELAGEAGSFKGFDPEARCYTTGSGGGQVSDEAGEKLQQYLDGTLADFEEGDVVQMKDRFGYISYGPDSDQDYKIKFHHSHEETSYIKEKDFRRTFLSFTDEEGAVVTLWPDRSDPGKASCSRDFATVPFGGFDEEDRRYSAGDLTGTVPKHRAETLKGFMAPEADIREGDCVTHKDHGDTRFKVKTVDLGTVTLLDSDGDETGRCPVGDVQKASLAFKIRVPECVTHGRHILEQRHVTGRSLNEIIESMGSDEGEDLSFSTLMRLGEQGISRKLVQGAFDAYTLGFVPALGCMLFHDGFGHADPHAGNLIYDDDEDTLWVIDWGATVQLDEEERRGLGGLVRACALGEFPPPAPPNVAQMMEESELALTGAGGTGVDSRGARMGLWRYILHPHKYPKLPEGMDLDTLKKQLEKARVVLCLETVILTSRLVSDSSHKAEKNGHRSSMSLLELWNDAVNLPSPVGSLASESNASALDRPRGKPAAAQEGVVDEVRKATIFRSATTVAPRTAPKSSTGRRPLASFDEDAPQQPKEDWTEFRGTRVVGHTS